MKKTRCMFQEAGLENKYWAEAVNTAVYLKNRSPTSAVKGYTPEGKWSNKKPKYIMLTRWLVLTLLAASWRTTTACTCLPDHPQTHFCNSDFVIVGRVQKMFRGSDFYDAYKVKIRNVFKATPKAAVALKYGRILTSSEDSLCGVNLQPRETYVITGRVVHLQAHVDLCGYINKWREVTPRQRKGFRLLYKQGCTCKVHVTRRRTLSPNTCVTSYDDCYERHGICLHDRKRRCRWTRAPALTRCLQAQHFNSTTFT